MKVLVVGLVCLAILSLDGLAVSSSTMSNTGKILPNASGRWFDYLVVIMLENHGINTTYGNACLGNCAFFDLLANTNSLAEKYDSGGLAGSLGDYIAITSGDRSVKCNAAPAPLEGCGPFNDVNIVDRLERSGLSWKAYMEDYPGTGSGAGYSSGGCFLRSTSLLPNNYTSAHNPFVYYQDIINSTQRCSRILRANGPPPRAHPACEDATNLGAVENDTLFLNDLNTVSNTANYTFLTPNTYDDLHDCPTGDVSLGNRYLLNLVPQILSSTLFRTKRAALLVTFDEDSPFVGASHNLYTVWASHGAVTRSGYKSNVQYNHFYSLRTIEDNWGLAPINSTDAGLGYDMAEVFA